MKRTTEGTGGFRARSIIAALAFLAITAVGCGGGGDSQKTQSGPLAPAPTGVASSSALTTFTSSIYGYSIAYPSNWTVRPAETQLLPNGYPDVESTGIDYFSETAPGDAARTLSLAIGAAGPAVPKGTTLENWAAQVEEAHRDLLGCPPAEAREDIQIGGEPGRLLTWQDCPAFLLWAQVVHDGHAFHVWLVDSTATGDPAVQVTDKALFTQVLASLAFTT